MALRKDAISPRASLLRARCLHKIGRRREAITDCEALSAATPESAETHGLLALLFYDEGQSDYARKHMDLALRYDSSQPEGLLVRGCMYSDAREYDDAQACFRALLEMYPDCGRAWLGMALIDLSHMRLEDAKYGIQLAVRYVPEHVGTWHAVAWIQLLRNDVSAAEAAFQCAYELDPNFAETHGGLAVVAALQGRDADAHSRIKRALRLAPQSSLARYAQILLLQRECHYTEADAVLTAVLAHPAGRDGVQYRDLVTAHLVSLRTEFDKASGAIVRH